MNVSLLHYYEHLYIPLPITFVRNVTDNSVYNVTDNDGKKKKRS